MIKMWPGLFAVIALQITEAIKIATKAGEDCGSTVYILISLSIVLFVGCFYLYKKNNAIIKEKDEKYFKLHQEKDHLSERIINDQEKELQRYRTIHESLRKIRTSD